MQRLTSRNSCSDHLAGFTRSIYAKWCSTMLLPPASMSMTVLSTRVGGNPWWNEVWKGNQPWWSLPNLIPPRRTLQISIKMCTGCRGCQGRCSVMRRWRHIFARRSCTLSKNASSISGFPHCWGRNWDEAQPASLGLTPKLNSMPGSMATYDRFMDVKWDSCKEALAVARDAHCWALVATALLEDKIGWMSCSLSHSCQCSRSHRYLGSCQQRRSQTADHWTKVPQVMSHHGDPARRQAQSPSPSQLRWWVTFAHSSPGSSPERDTGVKEPHLLTWRDERRPGDQSDWSRPKEEDLECPLPLEPHVQEFLRGGEMLLAGAGVRGGLPWISTPELSPMEAMEWIKWHMWQLDMPTWLQELKEVPSQDDFQEFARRVWVSFQVPKVRCHASKVDNNHSTLLAHHSLDRDWLLPLLDMWFGSQDFWLAQPQKTLAYVKALQYWAEKAQPLIPSEPCQLAESVLELWQMMELLTMFTDEEVLDNILPSNWVKITPSRLTEPTQRECSHSRTCQACSRGSFLVAYGEGQPGMHTTATAQMTSQQATLTQEVVPWQAESSSQP